MPPLLRAGGTPNLPDPVPSVQMATTYQYTPISRPRSIRILNLLPAKKSAPLKCELFETSLDADPVEPYEALSYVWGEQEPAYFVYCGQDKIRVTKNCHDALRQLRRRRNARQLWVDAICINQNLIPERNEQVQLMAELYFKATVVIAWLNFSSNHNRLTFRHVLQLQFLHWISQFGFPWIQTAPAGLIADLIHPSPDGKRADIFYLVFSRYIESQAAVRFAQIILGNEYFTRSWTSQEMLLARRSYFQLKNHSISSYMLEHLLRTVQEWSIWTQSFSPEASLAFECLKIRNSYFPSGSRQLIATSGGAENIIQLYGGENAGGPLGSERDYIDLIRMLRIQRCSDPRDRVFAVNEILQQHGLDMPGPDYTMTIAEVYATTTVKLATKAESLWILGCANMLSNSSLPSWAIEFNEASYSQPLHPLAIRTVYTRCRNRPKELPSHLQFIEYSQLGLHTAASIISQIHVSSERLQKGSQASQRDNCLSDSSILATVVARWCLDVGVSKLMKGLGDILILAIYPFEDTGRNLHELVNCLRTVSVTNPELDRELDTWHTNTESSTPPPKDDSWRLSEIFNLLNGFRLCILQSGQICFTSADVQSDDILVYLPRAELPFIIRSVGDNHMLVGWAYVIDMNDIPVGEIWKNITLV